MTTAASASIKRVWDGRSLHQPNLRSNTPATSCRMNGERYSSNRPLRASARMPSFVPGKVQVGNDDIAVQNCSHVQGGLVSARYSSIRKLASSGLLPHLVQSVCHLREKMIFWVEHGSVACPSSVSKSCCVSLGYPAGCCQPGLCSTEWIDEILDVLPCRRGKPWPHAS